MLVGPFVFLAIAAPFLPIRPPAETDWGAIRLPPSSDYLLGTHQNGRNPLSRMIRGAQASLLAGVVSVMIAVFAGVPLGVIAGWRGGWTDATISRMTEALLAVPFLILAIAFAAFLGPSLPNRMIGIDLSATPIFIRLTRGQTLAVKTEDYVESVRAAGVGQFSTLAR